MVGVLEIEDSGLESATDICRWEAAEEILLSFEQTISALFPRQVGSG